MKDSEYINEHLLGVSEDAYHGLNDKLEKNALTIPCEGWLYSPPHQRSFGNQLQIFLQKHLPKWLSWSIAEKKSQPTYYASGKLPAKISTTVRVISSMIVCLCSGASIIVPMAIMSFDPSKTKSLVTVSAAVVLFGFVLAAVVRAGSENVFIATTSYAAVLVVFVAVSGTAGS